MYMLESVILSKISSLFQDVDTAPFIYRVSYTKNSIAEIFDTGGSYKMSRRQKLIAIKLTR